MYINSQPANHKQQFVKQDIIASETCQIVV